MFSASQADVRALDNALEAQASAATQDPAWWNVVGQFRSAAAKMEETYARLASLADYVATRPAFAVQWNALMSRAATLRATVQEIRDKVASALNFLRSIGSSIGLSGLGILPAVIGVAAVAAAIAMVTKWTTDAINFQRAVEEQQRLERAGVPPERAAEIVRSTAAASQRSLFSFSVPWWPIALVAGAGGLAWYWRSRPRGRR